MSVIMVCPFPEFFNYFFFIFTVATFIISDFFIRWYVRRGYFNCFINPRAKRRVCKDNVKATIKNSINV